MIPSPTPTLPDTADRAAVEAFADRVAGDLGAAAQAPLVWIGDRLGLFRAMADGAPTTPAELARRAGTHARMTKEWLCAQAAGGYVVHDPRDGTFRLPPAHAAVLVDGTPATMLGGFDCVTGLHRSIDDALAAVRDGEGLGWHDQHDDFIRAVERFFRPDYESRLRQEWLPALGKPLDRLDYGGTIADVGCGQGLAATLLAKAFPLAEVHGIDFHGPSIERARRAARAAGVEDRCTFTAAPAEQLPDGPYDLVCLLDCLHDMADPAAVVRRVRQVLAPHGVVMVVEPVAGDAVEDNLTPLGRIMYAVSTMACTPCSLEGDGPALGAQAGPAAICDVMEAGGLADVGVVATTRHHVVITGRPPA